MATRLHPEHDARTREKIKTSQLVNRLMLHGNGECEMTQTQLRAAEILLKKTLPDLTSTEMIAETRNFVVSATPLTDAEWEAQYCLQ